MGLEELMCFEFIYIYIYRTYYKQAAFFVWCATAHIVRLSMHAYNSGWIIPVILL